MKKFLSLFILFSIISTTFAFAQNTGMHLDADFVQATPTEFSQKNFEKQYKAYKVTIRNNSVAPVLLSSDSEIFFILKNGSIIKSETRKQIYKKTRKADRGKYCVFAVPGKIVSKIVTYCTFFTCAALGSGIDLAMSAPADLAIKNNVKISKEVFYENPLPIKFDRNSQYNIIIFAPKDYDIEEIVISNISYDLKEMYELRIGAKK